MDAMDLLILIAVFQVKHFVADYLLQGRYMLGKFKQVGWEIPLLSHCAVHMVFTVCILSFYLPMSYAIGMALLDLIIHFAIDRSKVVISRPYTHDDKEFWWALGVDQMLHHFTHYALAFTTICLWSTP